MDIFQVAIVILFGLAISDLVVGVSNDAVELPQLVDRVARWRRATSS